MPLTDVTPNVRRVPSACKHLQDTTTRFDPTSKLLSFLLVCQICGIEKLIDTVRYEPRFESDSRRHAA